MINSVHYLPHMRTASHHLYPLFCNYSFCCCLAQPTWVCFSTAFSSPPLLLLLFSGGFNLEKFNELYFFSFLNRTFPIQFTTLTSGFPLSLIFIFFAFPLLVLFFCFLILISSLIFKCPSYLLMYSVCAYQDNAEELLTYQCLLVFSHSTYHIHSLYRDSNCSFYFNFILFSIMSVLYVCMIMPIEDLKRCWVP